MGRQLPSLADFPIPADVAPGRGWSPLMTELAAHIGALDVLRLCERMGGQEVYVPADAKESPFLPLLGARKAKALSWVYRRQYLTIPKGEAALSAARRGPILAAVRAGTLTHSDAARIMDVRRSYVSKLIGKTDEGVNVAPFRPRTAIDPRQLDMFG